MALALAAASLDVVVAHSQPLLVDGIAAALTDCPGVALVGHASTGLSALALIEESTPDVAVIELELADIGSLGLLSALTAGGVETRVLFLSELRDVGLVYECLAEGAAGCVSVRSDRNAVCDSVVAVGRGEVVLGPELATLLAGEIRDRSRANGPNLTEREQAVLELLSSGSSNREIGQQLFISNATVKSHLHQLYAKLNVHGRAGAVGEALRQHLVD